MKKTIPLVACLSLALATPALLGAAKIYKWTDAKGVTHYSEDPPPASSRNASEVKVPTRLPSGSQQPTTNAAKGTAAPAKKDGKTGKETGTATKDQAAGSERYAERCQKLRADQQTVQDHARIKVTDPNGESRVLSDDEKNAQLDDIQRQIKAYCE